jgi:hypothetical protein
LSQSLPCQGGGTYPARCFAAFPALPAKRKMAPKPKQPPGEPMDLGNMRKLGVRSLD